jgi:hypothetical protein
MCVNESTLAESALSDEPPDPSECEENFDAVRKMLVQDCDAAFAALTFETAWGQLKPRAGPDGSAGLIGRWGAAVRAFGDSDAETATLRYRQASRDSTPERRRRTRKK